MIAAYLVLLVGADGADRGGRGPVRAGRHRPVRSGVAVGSRAEPSDPPLARQSGHSFPTMATLPSPRRQVAVPPGGGVRFPRSSSQR